MASKTRPIVIINFKTYKESTGKNAILLAKSCDAAAKKYNIDIRIAVQATDLFAVAKSVKIPVYSQHVDCHSSGQSTGWITIDAIKSAGAKGSLINHAEHRIDTATIQKTTKLLRNAKLDAIVCAEHTNKLIELNSVNATIMCIEPPELIGGNISVTKAKPSIIKDAIKVSKKPLLIGAGVKTNEDLALALKLGACGVLLASGIVLAKNKTTAFKKLLE